MGNCLRPQSSTLFSGDDEDDWDIDFPAAKEASTSFGASILSSNNNCKTTTTTKEVKIKITKKQLAELLGKVDVNELRLEQVLAQLMAHNNNSNSSSLLQRPWRPALHSIPE